MQPPQEPQARPVKRSSVEPEVLQLISETVGECDLRQYLEDAFHRESLFSLELVALVSEVASEMVAQLMSSPNLNNMAAKRSILKILDNGSKQLAERQKKRTKREPSTTPSSATPTSPSRNSGLDGIQRSASFTLKRVNMSHPMADEFCSFLLRIQRNEGMGALSMDDGKIQIKCFACSSKCCTKNWSNFLQHVNKMHADKAVPLVMPMRAKAESSDSAASTSADSQSGGSLPSSQLDKMCADLMHEVTDFSSSPHLSQEQLSSKGTPHLSPN